MVDKEKNMNSPMTKIVQSRTRAAIFVITILIHSRKGLLLAESFVIFKYNSCKLSLLHLISNIFLKIWNNYMTNAQHYK